ncbi:malto-oligosyltrehalose synthase [Nocardia cyriacigeorgica]|uniref:Malto-oligosyltrehalose synthase n=1 Tax=Nocardia cyriacigeorgica TaxID=135487 RepID=A0A6P1D522_9NOCA|nr:malto-oligosyltrehalose synthase [Nocardia cyriacigeorgica]NEW41513.1 malto-oligosyltrehalose synthase [Nocardia cyriacigeorgica]NEW45716.1 malto-oligosyltrehalose synthase [Nocardia cyriacigeorgica]NEW52025.1 malto-oligosyltrehalose synthase [Nocardia cyriacigeorgica]NEW55818.1 malto-oligosyltrehalose synthase [Nocardia cyriacigeorgica]
MRRPARSTPVRSTYRLQLRPDALTFTDAAAIAEYLQQLGVSHLYLSPVMTAAHGSTHGYDVTDPTTVSAALGGPGGLKALADEVRSRGMGLIIDLVPNHVGVGDPRQNAWWWDVLRHGPDSQFAHYFDIDWSPANGAGGRLALPVLQNENDPAALTVDRSGPEPMLALHDLRFPIAPDTDGDNALRIHDKQHYRLVSWKSGLCSYRRFFAVSGLAALRQEDREVFEATHRELAAWCEHELIDGVRVDHPDGLSYPAAYLSRLRSLIGPHRLLLVEKILANREPLDATLPIDGTTGYDALADIGGVLIDPDGEQTLTELSQHFAGHGSDRAWIGEKQHRIKRAVAESILAPEIRRLVAAVKRDAGVNGFDASGISDMALTNATIEVLAFLPVYRVDYTPLAGMAGAVVADVEKRNSELTAPLSVLVAALAAGGEAAVRFSQVGGAITAKAVEDTMFYRAARLVSLQEVGGNPGRFGHSLNEFHLANSERAQRWPATLTALSTHDTKRGEDVRARIGVLSQMSTRWARSVATWQKITPGPDGATTLFLLQNMFGVWPADGRPAASVPGLRDRLHRFAEKAIREAGEHTSWEEPDPEFETAVHTWLDAVIDGPVGSGLGDLVHELAPHAWTDALSQKLLQLCGPGIPDIYQGCELWEDSLVDPDNRRPVDFATRVGMLQSLTGTPGLDTTGAAKMWIVAYALWLRRERPDCFVGGTYLPLFATGEQAGKLVSYARGRTGEAPEIIVATTRHSVSLAETGWADTVLDLPPGTWTDRLTGHTFQGRARLEKLFARLPVALLVR